jgi:hypothetical protein
MYAAATDHDHDDHHYNCHRPGSSASPATCDPDRTTSPQQLWDAWDTRAMSAVATSAAFVLSGQ